MTGRGWTGAARVLGLSAVMFFAAGCEDAGDDGYGGNDAAADQLGDGQILEVLYTVNEAEVEAGRLAADRARSAMVRDYANMMVNAHGRANDEIENAARDDLSRDESDLSNRLSDDAEAAMTRLEEARDEAFDKAYLDSQVKMHEDALRTIDEKLLPSARNAEVRRIVTTHRQQVAAHLAAARRLAEGGTAEEMEPMQPGEGMPGEMPEETPPDEEMPEDR